MTCRRSRADDGTGNRIEGSAAIEFDANTTTGTFTADIGNPQPLVTALLGTVGSRSADEAWNAGGSIALAGTWNGPLADPVVSITAGATKVSVATPTFSVEGGTIEASLNGPVSSPSGTMRVTASAVRASSLMPVPAEAQLSLKSGRLDVAAKVPDWSATLTGHTSVQAPQEFAATVSIADLTPERLVRLTGGQDPDQVAEGTISGTLEASGSFDRRRVRLTGKALLAGAELGGGESPFVDGLNAAVDMRDGRLWLTSLTARGFRGPVSASGDLPLSWVEEYLPEGWRVDGAPVPARPASFEFLAEPDVTALGAWLRPDEPGRMTGSLRLRMSGTASAPRADAIDGRIVLEPDTVTVRDVAFTLPRAAEVRIKDGRATVENATLTAPGTTASISGSLGLTGERALDAQVSASGALGFLSSLVPGRLAGAFKASFKATGTAADPQCDRRCVARRRRVGVAGAADLASGLVGGGDSHVRFADDREAGRPRQRRRCERRRARSGSEVRPAQA